MALRELKEESDSGKLRPAAPPPVAGPSRRFALVAAAVLLVAAGVWWFTRGRSPAAKPGLNLVLTRMTSDSGLTTDPALSPDGKLLAYASDRAGENNLDIWVQQVAGGAPIRLTTDPADESDPLFSPDGSKIAYHSRKEGGGIYVIPALGGDARLVAKAPLGGRRFSPDGNWIAYSVGLGLRPSKVFVVAAGGGVPREVKLDIPWACCPVWAPDGRHLLLMGSTDASGMFGTIDWWVAPTEGGRAVRTGATALFQRHGLSAQFAFSPVQWTGEHVYFSAASGDSTSLFRATLSPRDWQMRDAPERLTTGTGIEVHPSVASQPSGALRLAFASLTSNLDLWSLPVNANQGKPTGEPQRLTQTPAQEGRPSLSGDGRKLVFLSNRSGNQDVWIHDMQTGKETVLAASPLPETHPNIAPDGSRVVYAVIENQKPILYLIPASGGVPEKFYDDCGAPLGWSPDGKKVVYWWGQPIRFSVIDVATRERSDLVRHVKYNVHAVMISPDGRWLAFHVPSEAENGRSTAYVAPLQPGGVPENEWIAIGDGSTIDVHPWWSPDGNLLYFFSRRDGFSCLWTQRLAADTKHPIGPPQVFYHFHSARRSANEGLFGPGMTGDKMVVSLTESTGNIWMAVEK